jgi:CS domain
VPTGCGGKVRRVSGLVQERQSFSSTLSADAPTLCLDRRAQGPGYTWDQTPEAVELRLPLPVGTASREVRVEVLPLRIRAAVRGAVLLEGRLGGQVRAADTGDFEWEVAGDQLVVTMQKRCAIAPAPAPNCLARLLMRSPPHPGTCHMTPTRSGAASSTGLAIRK